MSTEINIDGPVSEGVSLPFEIVVQPTLTFFKSVAAPIPEKPFGSLLSTQEAEYRFTKADLNEFISSRRNRRKSVR
jgi:hypothetical protein